MRSSIAFILSAFFVVTCIGCGSSGSSGKGIISFHATLIEQDDNVSSVMFGISRISLSETGEEWTVVKEDIDDITIDSDSVLDLEEKELPAGEYHGVKIDLKPGITFTLPDSTPIDMDYPNVLLYRQGGMYRYSNSDNGFPDTNEYYMFTTRNCMLAAPMEVQPEETSFLLMSFRPMDLPGDGYGLAAKAAYTSFLY